MPSFDEVYDEHFEYVWRVVRSLGVPDELAEDAAQDVFLTVHRKLHEFEGRSSMPTWLFSIASRVASNYRRSIRRKGGLEELGEALEDTRSSPLESVSQQDALRLLEIALDALDEPKRIAFVLSEIEEMTVPQIAKVLELNVRTTYSRVRSARDEFARALARAQQRQR